MVFSEWGALLLEEEVHAIILLLEDATIDVADFEHDTGSGSGGTTTGDVTTTINNNKKENIALLFHRLVWCMKLLTLDQVIDIKRYKLPIAPIAPISSNGSSTSGVNGVDSSVVSVVNTSNSNPNADAITAPLSNISKDSSHSSSEPLESNLVAASNPDPNPASVSVSGANGDNNTEGHQLTPSSISKGTVYSVENDIYKDTWQIQVKIGSGNNNSNDSKNGNGSGRVLFDQYMIRCLLSRRIEFSRDAVAKIKLIQ